MTEFLLQISYSDVSEAFPFDFFSDGHREYADSVGSGSRQGMLGRRYL